MGWSEQLYFRKVISMKSITRSASILTTSAAAFGMVFVPFVANAAYVIDRPMSGVMYDGLPYIQADCAESADEEGETPGFGDEAEATAISFVPSFDLPDFSALGTEDETLPLHLINCDDEDGPGFTKAASDRAEQLLKLSNPMCGGLSKAYRIDCLAVQYKRIADGIERGGENERIREAFLTASQKLERIVEANVDTVTPPIQPRITVQGQQPWTSPRPLRPIAPEKQAVADRAAAVVVQELETKLLRSSENSDRRKDLFVKVADAVDSNKVLLRS